MSSRPEQGMRGFTLIEIAIAVALIGLLLGGVVKTLGAQQQLQRVRDADRQLAEINEALIGYALSRPGPRSYLPCPDTAGDGVAADRIAGDCPQAEGRLPWVTLGLGASDAWGNRYRYRVASAYSSSVGIGIGSLGDIRVCTRAACSAGELLALELAAVVVSHGQNGLGAWRAGGGVNPAPVASDEIANADADAIFVSREVSGSGGELGHYDDRLIWLSPHLLKHRLIQAGRLP